MLHYCSTKKACNVDDPYLIRANCTACTYPCVRIVNTVHIMFHPSRCSANTVSSGDLSSCIPHWKTSPHRSTVQQPTWFIQHGSQWLCRPGCTIRNSKCRSCNYCRDLAASLSCPIRTIESVPLHSKHRSSASSWPQCGVAWIALLL